MAVIGEASNGREAMLRAGAATLISKKAAMDEVYLAIRQVLAGEHSGCALPADR